jgi:hypothetical protein
VGLAQECERNTGPAKRPGAAEEEEEEEVDPLDAFMVGVAAEVKAEVKKPALSKQQVRQATRQTTASN